jgi:hypothetical protein
MKRWSTARPASPGSATVVRHRRAGAGSGRRNTLRNTSEDSGRCLTRCRGGGVRRPDKCTPGSTCRPANMKRDGRPGKLVAGARSDVVTARSAAITRSAADSRAHADPGQDRRAHRFVPRTRTRASRDRTAGPGEYTRRWWNALISRALRLPARPPNLDCRKSSRKTIPARTSLWRPCVSHCMYVGPGCDRRSDPCCLGNAR